MVGFPLLLIPLAVYNIIVFLMPELSFAAPIGVNLTLLSGTEWTVTLGDILLASGIVLLLLEIIKGARPGSKYLMDHLLSLIVFGAAAAEFLLLPKFGTSTYCLLALLALVDFISGIALRVRRGTAVAYAAAPASRRARKAEEPAAEVACRARAGAGPSGSFGACTLAGAIGRFGCRIRAARSSRAETGTVSGRICGPAAGRQPVTGNAAELIFGFQAITLACWPSLTRRSCAAMIACRISQIGTSTVGTNDHGACCIASEPGPGTAAGASPPRK